MLPVSQIQADELQPRKNFKPERMANLISSIKRFGIKVPLVVEKIGPSSYLIEEGERRWRAAKELGLKEVPCLVEEPKNAIDRLIQQFHLQEQHEGWSAVEKAVAVSRLSDELGVSIAALAEMLSLPSSVVNDYVSFSKIINKKEFEKNEVSLTYAIYLVGLTNFAHSVYEKELDQEFTREMKKDLENAIIVRIKDGTITRPRDLTRLKDSMRTDPRSIERFMKNRNVTVDKVFLESKGKKAYHYRNIVNSCTYLTQHLNQGMELGVRDLFEPNGKGDNAVKTALKGLKTLADSLKTLD